MKETFLLILQFGPRRPHRQSSFYSEGEEVKGGADPNSASPHRRFIRKLGNQERLELEIYPIYTEVDSSSRLSDAEGFLNGEDDVFDLRNAVILQDFGVRHGDVHSRYPGNRGVQIVKSRTWNQRRKKESEG